MKVEKYEIPNSTEENLKLLFDESMKILQTVKMRSDSATTHKEEDKKQLDKPNSNRLKLLQNILRDILVCKMRFLKADATVRQFFTIETYP